MNYYEIKVWWSNRLRTFLTFYFIILIRNEFQPLNIPDHVAHDKMCTVIIWNNLYFPLTLLILGGLVRGKRWLSIICNNI